MLDYNEFRRKLETSCKKLLEFEKLPLYSKCPTRDILENTNKQWSPVCYRQVGRTPAKESSRPSPSYEQDPENWNLFVNPETMMQYSKQGEFAEWTKKCKDGSSTTAVAVPSSLIHYDGVAATVKPEDGEAWCKDTSSSRKVPEPLRRTSCKTIERGGDIQKGNMSSFDNFISGQGRLANMLWRRNIPILLA